VHTQLQITYKHIHKFTVTINISIALYNLQHTQVHALCISSLVVHISSTHIYSNSFNKRYIIASRRRERPWTILGGHYFLQVRTSLELCPTSDLWATTITFFWASSFLRASSFFLLTLIYQVSAWLSFLAC
jgi:hypothetical protein